MGWVGQGRVEVLEEEGGVATWRQARMVGSDANAWGEGCGVGSRGTVFMERSCRDVLGVTRGGMKGSPDSQGLVGSTAGSQGAGEG